MATLPNSFAVTNTNLDFPGGAVDKNLPVQETTGSIPGLGRFHMPQSNWTLQLQLLKPACSSVCALQQEEPPQWEARAPHWRVGPACCNWRKPTQSSNEDSVHPKINKYFLKNRKRKTWVCFNAVDMLGNYLSVMWISHFTFLCLICRKC